MLKTFLHGTMQWLLEWTKFMRYDTEKKWSTEFIIFSIDVHFRHVPCQEDVELHFL
jgi:hypothetical protein